MSVRVFAPAKINLTLEVGAPRVDGMHPLQSVVSFADVGDVIEAACADALTLTIDGEFADGLSRGEDNLVLRAARALALASGKPGLGAAIRLEKSLPVASGIGGGSADAAATLRALNQLWELGLPAADLAVIARPLGADVPVCVASLPAYMRGTGPDWAPLHVCAADAVLVNPLQPLPTAAVYQRFDAMGLGAGFTERPAEAITSRAALDTAVTQIGNDLLAPARALAPVLDAVEAALRGAGCATVGLSGSGATMFALTADADEAARVAELVQTQHPDWWVSDAVLGGA